MNSYRGFFNQRVQGPDRDMETLTIEDILKVLRHQIKVKLNAARHTVSSHPAECVVCTNIYLT